MIACTVKLAFFAGNLCRIYIILNKDVVRGGEVVPGQYTIVLVIGNDCEHIRGYHRVTSEKAAMKILRTYTKAFDIEQINASNDDVLTLTSLFGKHGVGLTGVRVGNILM